MGDKSSIEWTDATWNPVRGCSIVSKGCTNCYAMRQAHRSSGAGGAYEGLTKMTKGGPVWTGAIRTVPELLDRPLKWQRPRRIFVNSMSDLFHEDVPDDFITRVWKTMADSPQHVFQILTKRPQRMRDYLLARLTIGMYIASPLTNVWLGVSAEDQPSAEERIPLLLQTPAAVHWISGEPLLGPIDIEALRRPDGLKLNALFSRTHIDWVVAGGESGPGARPMHPDWARSLRDQCAAAGVAFFFKQWGTWAPCELEVHTDERGREIHPLEESVLNSMDVNRGYKVIEAHDAEFFLAGKKLAGRTLDGRTHDEYPA